MGNSKYRTPELDEFIPGFEYEFRSSKYELEGEPIATVVKKDLWVKQVVLDTDNEEGYYSNGIEYLYNYDKNLFRVKD